MTAADAYELITQGGATDFARMVEACDDAGPWCLIGDAAINCFVEPLYTLDVEIVIVSSARCQLVDLERPSSRLRIQFTTDPGYQTFLERSVDAVVLGVPAKIACLQDTAQEKLWAYSDPQLRFSKRKKDELDLIRLAEAWPELRTMYPLELLEQIDRS